MFTLMPYRPYLTRPSQQRRVRLMDDPFFRNFMSMNDAPSAGSFRVDIREKDDAFLLEAELPGASEENIKISVDDNILTIAASMNTEREDEQENYYYCERRSGHMSRSFSLDNINQDGITADYANGILSVTLPKEKPAPEKTARSIQINTARIAGETGAEQSE